MSDSKLQELIDTLKKQAVERGEASSREIIEQAQKEAQAIVDRAKGEADDIVRQARDEADKKAMQLESSMQIAGSQFVTSLKRDIEQNLLALPLRKSVSDALGDTGYLKELIRTVVLQYTGQEDSSDLQVIVPKDQQEKLYDFMVDLVNAQSDHGDPDHKGLSLRLHILSDLLPLWRPDAAPVSRECDGLGTQSDGTRLQLLAFRDTQRLCLPVRG